MAIAAVLAFFLQGIVVEALDDIWPRVAVVALALWLAFRFGQIYERTEDS